MMAKRVLFALLVGATFVLAGCVNNTVSNDNENNNSNTNEQSWPGDPGAITTSDADKAKVQSAANKFQSAVKGDGGDLKRLHGNMDIEDDEAGFTAATFAIEWGQGNVQLLNFEAGAGGFKLEFGMYCSPTKQIILFGEEAYEMRGTGDECDFNDDADDFSTPISAEFEDISEIRKHNDGSYTATFEEDGTTFTVLIDPDGRIVRMDMEGVEGTGTFLLEYGQRRNIPVPTDVERVPATVYLFEDFFGSTPEEGIHKYDASTGEETPFPRSEAQVRVYSAAMETDEFDEQSCTAQTQGTALATFPLNGADTQEAGGFSFTFTHNGNDAVDDGDSVTISNAAWTGDCQYLAVLWDTWADAEAGTNPIPGPGAVLLVLGLLGAVLLARRRE